MIKTCTFAPDIKDSFAFKRHCMSPFSGVGVVNYPAPRYIREDSLGASPFGASPRSDRLRAAYLKSNIDVLLDNGNSASRINSMSLSQSQQ